VLYLFQKYAIKYIMKAWLLKTAEYLDVWIHYPLLNHSPISDIIVVSDSLSFIYSFIPQIFVGNYPLSGINLSMDRCCYTYVLMCIYLLS
jgi:hypothetical protein